ncbi:hypothetical protein HER32_06735 [Hymenobacter sp. BT18]|uniref:fibronectin type III domain-containing protein n=1 Tax=Hymenobacter sp. BT18 TaxID=2835648 RepID=UPI00143E336E|nr:fibronectin type III domain-containing protein [Hymenobacter sp. BT18]QIX60889.1 hypothetical protein HER32_06735 [Hymenobacter sp. BT18]
MSVQGSPIWTSPRNMGVDENHDADYRAHSLAELLAPNNRYEGKPRFLTKEVSEQQAPGLSGRLLKLRALAECKKADGVTAATLPEWGTQLAHWEPVGNAFTLIAANTYGSHPAFSDQHSYNIWLLQNRGTTPAANSAPSVSFVLSSASVRVGETITATITATDSDGLVNATELLVNGASVGTDVNAPYIVEWAPTEVGTFAVQARATDNSGNATLSASQQVTVTAANLAPSVTALSTSAPSVAAGNSITLSATATDPDGTVATVEFFLDGVSRGVASNGPNFSVVITPSVTGTRQLTAIATDNEGLASELSASVSFTVTGANTVPGQVSGIIATPTTTTMDLVWSPPADGGSPITDYEVRYRLQGDATWALFADGVNTNTSVAVTGLTPSKVYEFTVTAKNAVGSGTASAIITRPTSTPKLDATSDFFGQGISSTENQMSWLLPLNAPESGVTYVLERSINSNFSGFVVAYTGPETTIIDAGLTADTRYYYRVKSQAAGYQDSEYATTDARTKPATTNTSDLFTEYFRDIF